MSTISYLLVQMDLLIVTAEQKHRLPASIVTLHPDNNRLIKLKNTDENCQ